jgi:RNA polymerase sigma-70 factor (ECF subfamily)
MEKADHDCEWMLRLQNGEDTALNELMNRWQVPLVSFIYRYIGNEADAIDLAQETFIRVFESRNRYKPTAKFSTWLFTIASNLCRNLSRWRKRHPTVSLTPCIGEEQPRDLTELLPDQGDSPADSMQRKEVAAVVQESVQALPHDLRTVVLLFEYGNQSYEEIAGVVGCSAKAVETRLYRARKILRERLASLESDLTLKT